MRAVPRSELLPEGVYHINGMPRPHAVEWGVRMAWNDRSPWRGIGGPLDWNPQLHRRRPDPSPTHR